MAEMFPMIRSSLDRLRDEIDHTFDRWLPRQTESQPEGSTEVAPVFASPELPRIDMEEDENELRVTAELPGLEKDDFKVELVGGNRLLIEGEKKTSREEKKGSYHFSELSYGSFARSIPLPCEVDPSRIEANYKNGILNLRLPKTEQSKAKMIDVKIT